VVSSSAHKEYSSEKYKKFAFKYEVMISICECRIVWINAPFPGSTNDLTIYRSSLKASLLNGEIIGGYSDQAEPFLMIPYKRRPGQRLTNDELEVNQILGSDRVRVEQVNRF
jgi:hypothetical protein